MRRPASRRSSREFRREGSGMPNSTRPNWLASANAVKWRWNSRGRFLAFWPESTHRARAAQCCKFLPKSDRPWRTVGGAKLLSAGAIESSSIVAPDAEIQGRGNAYPPKVRHQQPCRRGPDDCELTQRPDERSPQSGHHEQPRTGVSRTEENRCPR